MTEIEPTEKHELPSGAVVELLIIGDRIKAKHSKAVARAISDTEGRLGAQAIDMIDGVTAMLVVSWTVTDDDGEILPIPKADLDSLEEMDMDDYDALVSLPLIQSTLQRILAVRRPVVTPDDHEDELSPTGPSGAPRPRSEVVRSVGPAETTGSPKSKTPGGRSGGAGRRSRSAN